ncbi:hypothetical protein TraAM80_03405 [Trypanosoma rangeli]|uniref:Secreted protein n=1 Tax=Trypanosoma rangeli TaxID=5698 RepID=A0A3R7KGL5_TRYRA|nr:uncharacterized protein TraAM80_03405 [Trypanosoma rangeli]RNF07282.1 hypothetical protein TraAM80_03405 [Trypanosoma rangeli]|eukprot:RNF07282.1 hypothetical protein TraAM80_03405 [Trypanosoma rangeli]
MSFLHICVSVCGLIALGPGPIGAKRRDICGRRAGRCPMARLPEQSWLKFATLPRPAFAQQETPFMAPGSCVHRARRFLDAAILPKLNCPRQFACGVGFYRVFFFFYNERVAVNAARYPTHPPTPHTLCAPIAGAMGPAKGAPPASATSNSYFTHLLVYYFRFPSPGGRARAPR